MIEASFRNLFKDDLDFIFSLKGYYRVNYDKTNWQLIIKQLNKNSFGNISTINRAQLIDDALNLARAGRLDYATALSVTSYLAHETEYLPWKAAFTAMHYLDSMLIKMPSYDRFRVNANFFFLNFPNFVRLKISIFPQIFFQYNLDREKSSMVYLE